MKKQLEKELAYAQEEHRRKPSSQSRRNLKEIKSKLHRQYGGQNGKK